MAEGLRRARWQSLIETAALVAIAVAVGWMAVIRSTPTEVPTPVADGDTVPPARPTTTRGAAPPVPVEPIALSGAQVTGSQSAKVGLVIYSDFQCPFCRKFARETLPILKEHYVRQGKLLVAFRQFPLPNRPVAMKAAEAATCAGDQGKFWEMHDWIFASQPPLTSVALRAGALALHLDEKMFAHCTATGATDRVNADKLHAAALQISGTPTFFVGTIAGINSLSATHRLSGARPAVDFIAAIDAALGEQIDPASSGQRSPSPR